jgi:DNA-binding MarR family transcriptional regulator
MSREDRFRAALDRILELSVVINDDMTTALARHGLTASRTHLLWELRRLGPTTQRALAEALRVSPRTVTGLVDGLAATGFVTRQPHPSDRRATLVTFTERGDALVFELENGQRQFADLLFSGMADDRFDGLVCGLDEVLDRLTQAGVTWRREEEA